MLKLLLALVFSSILVVGGAKFASAQPVRCNPSVPNACPPGQNCVFDPTYGTEVCQTPSGPTTPPVLVKPWEKDCYTEETPGTKIATLQGFGCIFRNFLTIAVPLLGLMLFVLLISGGFGYMTAGGDPKQTQKASGTITAAIIGIVVVVGVWFIFRILGVITGLNLLNFVIPG